MKRAVITGASSGIGLSLAQELSRRGYAVALLARRRELLETAADALNDAGGKAVAFACDAGDSESVDSAVRRAEEALGGPFDLAVANAGVSIHNHGACFDLTAAEQVIRVNVLGVMYLYAAVIPSMVSRRSGRFVGVASVAGLRGLPSAGPYSASKAAVQTFLESARVDLTDYGVGVTIVNPGFVETAMTAKNTFHMPFLMQGDRAARIMADGIERGARIVEFPLRMSLLMRTARFLPDALYDRIMVPQARRK